MEKNSSENKPCTFCCESALPNTDPPVCEKHLMYKKASDEPSTLKELDTHVE